MTNPVKTKLIGLVRAILGGKPSRNHRISDKFRDQSFVLLSPMRNEGANILEWLAWHKAVGFTDILVVSNNCDDGSDKLLDHLASMGHLEHLNHNPVAGSFALDSAFKAARKHSLVTSADWVMILDADEFLVVHVGDHTIQSLIAQNGRECLGMAINWKCFGDGGQKNWADGMVRETFTRCAEGADAANMRFKSVFRQPMKFAGFKSHAPFGYNGEWGGANSWIDSEGKRLNAIRLVGDTVRRATKKARITHVDAQVNHYVTKSQESMLERRQKWERSGRADRYDAEFEQLYNKNDGLDETALANNDKFEQEYAKLAHDPEVLRMHHACCAAYASKLATLAGKDPSSDARYLHHLSLSQ